MILVLLQLKLTLRRWKILHKKVNFSRSTDSKFAATLYALQQDETTARGVGHRLQQAKTSGAAGRGLSMRSAVFCSKRLCAAAVARTATRRNGTLQQNLETWAGGQGIGRGGHLLCSNAGFSDLL